MKTKEKNNILVAITGNICSGKSFLLKIVEEMGYPVFSFDKEADLLISSDKFVQKEIEDFFPEVTEDGKVSKVKLGNIVFLNRKFLKVLEEILRPKLYIGRDKFIKNLGKKQIAFFEVPLLFEKKREGMYDQIILLTTSDEVQSTRIKARKIPEEKAKNIIKLQVSADAVKAKADYVIDSNVDLVSIKKIIKEIIIKLESEF